MDSLHYETSDSNRKSPYKIGGVAALLCGVLLLFAAVCYAISYLSSGTNSGWLPWVQNNWLIIIFSLLTGSGSVNAGQLHVLNPVDFVILALAGMMCLGLFVALQKISKTGTMIALILPFLGIVLLAVTKIAGRSAVMGTDLIFSFIMMRSNIFGKATIYLGILSGMFLLAGDFSAGIIHSIIIAALFGSGYMLLTIWFFLIARKLFQLGKVVADQ